MDVKFAGMVESLHPSFERLIASAPYSGGKLPKDMPASGVYLFTEDTKHLYIGRSNRMRSRYGRHCNPGATHRMAAFAFRLARETTGQMKAAYKSGESSRAGLILQPAFKAAFVEAKARIRCMEYRFVEEADQTRQALLEIYCSVSLATAYNDFNTH